MSERSEELTEERDTDATDADVDDALAEAQSVIDRVEETGASVDAANSGNGAVDDPTREHQPADGATGTGETGDEGRSWLPSVSRPRIRGPSSWFSVRKFVLSGVAATLGLMAGFLVPVVPVSNLVGLFVAAFVVGLASNDRPYLEMGLAGVLASVVFAFVLTLPLTLLGGLGLPLTPIGGVTGGVVALLGAYFGRDLRGGLTSDV
jgi:hypothetical protein